MSACHSECEDQSGAKLSRTNLAAVGVCCLKLLQQVVSLGSSDDLVINISDVHDIQDAVAKVVLQDASDNVKGDVVSCVPHVCAVIDCGSTFIPS